MEIVSNSFIKLIIVQLDTSYVTLSRARRIKAVPQDGDIRCYRNMIFFPL